MTAPANVPDQARRRTAELSARADAQRQHRYRTVHERPDPALNGSGIHVCEVACACGQQRRFESKGTPKVALDSAEGWISRHVEDAADAAGRAAVAALVSDTP